MSSTFLPTFALLAFASHVASPMPPRQQGTLTNAPGAMTYRLVNVNSGLALDVTGASPNSGALIQQYSYWGGANQRWSLVYNPDGTYKIVNVGSGKVLDVTNWSTSKGTQIQQWDDDNTPNQKWILNSQPDGSVTVTNSYSGLCLDVTNWSQDNGAAVQQWTCYAQLNQLFRLEALDSAGQPVATASVPNVGSYRILSGFSNIGLDVLGATTQDGATVQLYSYFSGLNQRWQLTAHPDGTYNVVGLQSNKPLDVAQASMQPGTPVNIWTANGGASQLWRLLRRSQDNLYFIVNVHSGLCLDGGGGQATLGSVLQQNTCGSTQTQAWQLNAVDPSGDPISTIDSGCSTPFDGEPGVIPGTPLSWSIDGPHDFYNIYFGTTNPPPRVASQTGNTYDAPAMAPSTTYFWRVSPVLGGSEIAGPTWTFSTAPARPAGQNVNYQRDYDALPLDARFEAGLWGNQSQSQWIFGQTLHVDIATGNDNATGDQQNPLRSIGAAIARIQSGAGTHIIIHPGTYAESIIIQSDKSGADGHPIVIDAAQPGTVTLSGADVWQQWRQESGNVFSAPWTMNWGPDPQPNGWPLIAELGRRREMVIVDGALYQQVGQCSQMTHHTYCVDDGAQKIYVWLDDANPGAHRIEVAVRSTEGIKIGDPWWAPARPSYIALRGITVKYFNDNLIFAQHLLVEDSVFDTNNGAVSTGGTDIIWRRNRILHAGKGFGTPPVGSPDDPNFHYANTSHSLFEDNQTLWGNWRWGGLGNFHAFAVAGFKAHSLDNTIVRGHISRFNDTLGLWFDCWNRNVLVEDSLITDNTNDGMWLEISPGATLIRDNVIAHNQGKGLNIANSSHVMVTGNIIYGNQAESLGNWTPSAYRQGFVFSYLHFFDNILAFDNGTDQPYINMPAGPDNQGGNYDNLWNGPTAILSRRNFFSGSSRQQAWVRGSSYVDFATWSAAVGEMGSSTNPLYFRNTQTLDFFPQPGSGPAQSSYWSFVNISVDSTNQATLTSTSNGPMVYTLDGTVPKDSSVLYQAPVNIPAGTLRARGQRMCRHTPTAWWPGI